MNHLKENKVTKTAAKGAMKLGKAAAKGAAVGAAAGALLKKIGGPKKADA